MPLYTGLVTIKRGGKYHPPGTVHDLSEDVAKSLGPSRVRLAPDQTAVVAEPAIELAGDLPGLEPAGDAPGDVLSAVAAPPTSQQTGGASNRIADIKHALDLLEPKDFWKSGARAGKPKQKVIEEIVGFDISEADIDAALLLRDAGI
ncbi:MULTISPECIES: hypothetical protein [unclassified Bradyrhizobium]|uniref:hypothetical protein n=1 Tax=unclassified Bradyrhizobium TaxID=2631580 RepID=UPI002915F5D3|nr:MULTISPECIES: hypothetical protein [unclassified Bradyrhizobium]